MMCQIVGHISKVNSMQKIIRGGTLIVDYFCDIRLGFVIKSLN